MSGDGTGSTVITTGLGIGDSAGSAAGSVVTTQRPMHVVARSALGRMAAAEEDTESEEESEVGSDEESVVESVVDDVSDDTGGEAGSSSEDEDDDAETVASDEIEELDALAEIALLDRSAEECDAKGDSIKSLFFREQALVRRQMAEVSDEEFAAFCYKLAVQYNTVAMVSLSQQKTDDALAMLKKADVLTSSTSLFQNKVDRARLRALTYNNFGCVYKQCGQLHTALKHLDKALHIESMCAACENPAGTHLNVCAILSLMGRHRGALQHAEFAKEILEAEKELARQEELVEKRERRKRRRAAGKTPETNDSDDEEPPRKDEGAGKNLLTIAYYNMAVEQEHMKMLAKAVKTYKAALKVAQRDLGEHNPMYAGISVTLAAAARDLELKQSKKRKIMVERLAAKNKVKRVSTGPKAKGPPRRKPGASSTGAGAGAGAGAGVGAGSRRVSAPGAAGRTRETSAVRQRAAVRKRQKARGHQG